jgi:hypothetical protein
VVVKEQTRGFRETNVHMLKAILNFLLAIIEFCEVRELLLPQWASIDIAAVCVERISDRKLSEVCKTSLSTACVVSEPSMVILHSLQHLEKNVKSPVAHEEMMKWLRSFCNDFGAAQIGSKIGDIIPILLEVCSIYLFVRFYTDTFCQEMTSSNVKVKREATLTVGAFHVQMGPVFKALCCSLAKPQALKSDLAKCFETYPFDSGTKETTRTRFSLAARNGPSGEGTSSLAIPKTNLFEGLPDDIMVKLVSLLSRLRAL